MGRNTRRSENRQRLALEAARIMADGGLDDINSARRRAADRLGVTEREALPSNAEIEEAYRGYTALFGDRRQTETLRKLRQIAIDAMGFLAKFNPKLVGPVLEGTANAHSTVELHAFAPTAEDISRFLIDKHIPYQEGEARLHIGGGERVGFPTFSFVAQDTPVEIIVFSHDGVRHAPARHVDGRPPRRANIAEVKALLV